MVSCKVVLTALLFSTLFAQSITVVGVIENPDQTAVNGTLELALAAAAPLNTCTNPVTPIAFAPHVSQIVGGAITPVQIFPTTCLKPPNPYLVTVYDRQRNLLFQSTWIVPQQNLLPITPDIGFVDAGSAVPFQTAAQYATVTTTTPGLTQLVSGTAGRKLQVYSVFFLLSQSYAPTNFGLVSATNCQTNQHNLIPIRPGAANIGQTYVQYFYTPDVALITSAPGDDICLYLSNTPLKATVQIMYNLTFP